MLVSLANLEKSLSASARLQLQAIVKGFSRGFNLNYSSFFQFSKYLFCDLPNFHDNFSAFIPQTECGIRVTVFCHSPLTVDDQKNSEDRSLGLYIFNQHSF